MPSITSGSSWSLFKKILGATWEDEQLKSKGALVWPKYLDEEDTEDRYFDDVEIVDMGLFTEKEEGQNIALDSFGEGLTTRYVVKTFAKRLEVPEEVLKDNKYKQVTDGTRRLSNSASKSQEYDGVSVLNNAFSSSFTGADGVALCASNHPLRGGGTYSNAPTALTLSNTALQTYIVALDKMAGTNGLICGVMPKRLVVPSDLRFRAAEILKSAMKDDTANHTINALKGELSDFVAVPYMSSTTNWFIKTDAKRGLMWVWREKPEFRQSNNDTAMVKEFTGYYRATKGWSNPRGVIGSNI